MLPIAPLDTQVLPPGVRARFVTAINGLDMHVLEAGFEPRGRPAILLLHGFPELAFSWRKLMGPLAAAGFHVIAPDQRGYGRTRGWTADYDGDLAPFRALNLVRDALGLVAALGLRDVAGVVGHDFGSYVAAWCALLRPDVFRTLTLMSAPFAGPPLLPEGAPVATPVSDIHAELARLSPPRKHYHAYYSTREADANMRHCPQGLPAFLRAYLHMKSADWQANRPYRLAAWTASELAKLPTYYVMELGKGMAETVAAEMPSPSEIAGCGWLTERELGVYSGEYARTGFQGGLNWYRCRMVAKFTSELEVFSGRSIDVPSVFISGKNDWGVHQRPGDLERMQGVATTNMKGCHLIEGAGHWVQQEKPDAVAKLLLDFLRQ